jgi:hypothetical protein
MTDYRYTTTVPQPVCNEEERETLLLSDLRALVLQSYHEQQKELQKDHRKSTTTPPTPPTPPIQPEPYPDDPTHSLHSDRVLIRFLRARKGNLSDAATLWSETMEWRREQNASQWRTNAPGPLHDKKSIDIYAQHGFESLNGIEKHPYTRLVAPLHREHEYSYRRWVVNGHFGHDKAGHPLYWERTGIGAQLFPNLVKELTHDEIIYGHIRQQELALGKCEEASIKFNKYIGKQTVIMDMKGMSFWPRAGGVSVFKRILLIDSKYYPELLANHFIINAPFIFTGVWAMIKPWLDPITAAKINVMGKHYLPTLLEKIDAAQIPIEFGGTSKMFLDNALTQEGEAEKYVEEIYGYVVQKNVGSATSAGEQKVDSAAVDVGSTCSTCTNDVDVGANVKPIARVHIEDVEADKEGNKTISI